MIRLGFNVDHVATVRNARGEFYPDPIQAAQLAVMAGADNITCHLREDRRHIRDRDVERLKECIEVPLNLEMAVTDEMLGIACRIKPHCVTLVPEKRQERTTEGGLDLQQSQAVLKSTINRLKDSGIMVSLFVEPTIEAAEASKQLGADAVEFHSGRFCESFNHAVKSAGRITLLQPLISASQAAKRLGMQSHIGHGLNYSNANFVQLIPHCEEANIGHAIVARSIFVGLERAIVEMKDLLNRPELCPHPQNK
jgi:pyridoxine 5-phosphate synthase